MGNDNLPHPFRTPAEMIRALRQIDLSKGWRAAQAEARALRRRVDDGAFDGMSRAELSAAIESLSIERDRIRGRVAFAAESGLPIAATVTTIGTAVALKVLGGEFVVAAVVFGAAVLVLIGFAAARRWLEAAAQIDGAIDDLRKLLNTRSETRPGDAPQAIDTTQEGTVLGAVKAAANAVIAARREDERAALEHLRDVEFYTHTVEAEMSPVTRTRIVADDPNAAGPEPREGEHSHDPNDEKRRR